MCIARCRSHESKNFVSKYLLQQTTDLSAKWRWHAHEGGCLFVLEYSHSNFVCSGPSSPNPALMRTKRESMTYQVRLSASFLTTLTCNRSGFRQSSCFTFGLGNRYSPKSATSNPKFPMVPPTDTLLYQPLEKYGGLEMLDECP